MSEAWLQWVVGPSVLLLVGLLVEVLRRLLKVDRQVSRNGGQNNPTTVPDRICKVEAKVDANGAVLLAAIGALSQKFDDHLEWSTAETAELWRAIGRR